MATQSANLGNSGNTLTRLRDDLLDPTRSIAGPVFDALLFWGCPLLAMGFVASWLGLASFLPSEQEARAIGVLGFASAIITYAHLVAVVPRAYGNREVFAQNRIRLTLVPVMLLAALLLSPACFVIGTVLTVFWDIHHSALQNFGLSRIYDLRAGNEPKELRWTDLRLNWMLYVGPLAAGASLPLHLQSFGEFSRLGWHEIATLPGVLEGNIGLVAQLAIAGWLATFAWSLLDYRKAIRSGYRMPAHKLANIASSGIVSLVAWGFCSPPFALATINIYHALQYFALVWIKEGRTMQGIFGLPPRRAFDVFIGLCVIVALAYQYAATASIQWLLAPFIACSLLHFWFDGFVWSVRKRQV